MPYHRTIYVETFNGVNYNNIDDYDNININKFHHIDQVQDGIIYTHTNEKIKSRKKNKNSNLHLNLSSRNGVMKVFNDIPGLLEHILTFLQPKDILHCTSYINKRFYNASRDGDLWKLCCIYKWKDKSNMPKVRNWSYAHYFDYRKGGIGKKSRRNRRSTRRKRRKTRIDIALFWRMKVDPDIIQSSSSSTCRAREDSNMSNGLSIQEMKTMLLERPLGLFRKVANHNITKNRTSLQ
jgi:hypothetical protein